MSEPQSLNTMFQGSFETIDENAGEYALRTTGSSGGTPSEVTIDPTGNTVKIDQTSPNNRVEIDPDTNTVKIDQTGTNNVVVTNPNAVSNSTSVTDTATVNAPAAGATVCETAILAAGTWDLEAITFIGGTTVASVEQTNMRLRIGATAISRILNPVPGTTGGIGTGQLRVRVVAPGGVTANIIAVAAATASSVYSGSIVARRVL